MIANYSRTMPVSEAIRLTFTPNNLCGVCELVADARTRADLDGATADTPAADPAAKAKAPLAPPPRHLLVFCAPVSPTWQTGHFEPLIRARAAPPDEPPRAA